MIPQAVLNALKDFNHREIQIMAESLKILFDNKETKYPFNDTNKMFGEDGEWSRSDILHYLNQINFDIEHQVCMDIMCVISTILVSRQF